MNRISGALHERQYKYFVVSRQFLLRTRNVWDKSCRENQNTYFVFSNFFYFFENLADYEKTWENIVERGRPHVAIRRMRTACRIAKATNTHSQYVILIAFPLQQWLHERPSVSRYTYIACLVHCHPVAITFCDTVQFDVIKCRGQCFVIW
jgi:hypothetical protein